MLNKSLSVVPVCRTRPDSNFAKECSNLCLYGLDYSAENCEWLIECLRLAMGKSNLAVASFPNLPVV